MVERKGVHRLHQPERLVFSRPRQPSPIEREIPAITTHLSIVTTPSRVNSPSPHDSTSSGLIASPSLREMHHVAMTSSEQHKNAETRCEDEANIRQQANKSHAHVQAFLRNSEQATDAHVCATTANGLGIADTNADDVGADMEQVILQTRSLFQCHQGLLALRHIRHLDKMTRLRSLNVHMNSIARVEGLSTLRNLVELDLSANELRTLDPGCFRGLHRLRKLNLSSNYLTVIPTGILAPLRALQWLSVAFNELFDVSGLRSIPATAKLHHVDLCGNCIASLDAVEHALQPHREHVEELRLRTPQMSAALLCAVMAGSSGTTTAKDSCHDDSHISVNDSNAATSRDMRLFSSTETDASLVSRLSDTVVALTPPDHLQLRENACCRVITETGVHYVRRLQDYFVRLRVLDGVRYDVDPLQERKGAVHHSCMHALDNQPQPMFASSPADGAAAAPLDQTSVSNTQSGVGTVGIDAAPQQTYTGESASAIYPARQSMTRGSRQRTMSTSSDDSTSSDRSSMHSQSSDTSASSSSCSSTLSAHAEVEDGKISASHNNDSNADNNNPRHHHRSVTEKTEAEDGYRCSACETPEKQTVGTSTLVASTNVLRGILRRQPPVVGSRAGTEKKQRRLSFHLGAAELHSGRGDYSSTSEKPGSSTSSSDTQQTSEQARQQMTKRAADDECHSYSDAISATREELSIPPPYTPPRDYTARLLKHRNDPRRDRVTSSEHARRGDEGDAAVESKAHARTNKDETKNNSNSSGSSDHNNSSTNCRSEDKEEEEEAATTSQDDAPSLVESLALVRRGVPVRSLKWRPRRVSRGTNTVSHTRLVTPTLDNSNHNISGHDGSRNSNVNSSCANCGQTSNNAYSGPPLLATRIVCLDCFHRIERTAERRLGQLQRAQEQLCLRAANDASEQRRVFARAARQQTRHAERAQYAAQLRHSAAQVTALKDELTRRSQEVSIMQKKHSAELARTHARSAAAAQATLATTQHAWAVTCLQAREQQQRSQLIFSAVAEQQSVAAAAHAELIAHVTLVCSERVREQEQQRAAAVALAAAAARQREQHALCVEEMKARAMLVQQACMGVVDRLLGSRDEYCDTVSYAASSASWLSELYRMMESRQEHCQCRVAQAERECAAQTARMKEMEEECAVALQHAAAEIAALRIEKRDLHNASNSDLNSSQLAGPNITVYSASDGMGHGGNERSAGRITKVIAHGESVAATEACVKGETPQLTPKKPSSNDAIDATFSITGVSAQAEAKVDNDDNSSDTNHDRYIAVATSKRTSLTNHATVSYWRTVCSQREDELVQLRAVCAIGQNTQGVLTRENDRLLARIDELQRESVSQQSRAEGLSRERDAAQRGLRNLQDSLSRREQDCDNMEREARAKLDSKRARIAELEEHVESLHAALERSREQCTRVTALAESRLVELDELQRVMRGTQSHEMSHRNTSNIEERKEMDASNSLSKAMAEQQQQQAAEIARLTLLLQSSMADRQRWEGALRGAREQLTRVHAAYTALREDCHRRQVAMAGQEGQLAQLTAQLKETQESARCKQRATLEALSRFILTDVSAPTSM